MVLWNLVIDVLRDSMLAYAYWCNGNLGYGIVIVTFLARLALLPIGIRLARRAQVQQLAMQRIQPELDALRSKHKGNSRRLAEETHRLMMREGISPLGGLFGTFAQIPVFVALYSAVRRVTTVGGRFWWIADIAKPDAWLTIAATVFAVAAATGAPATSNRLPLMIVSGVVTAIALSRMAAGVGLYWGLSSLFGAVQSLVVGRPAPTSAA